MRRHAIFIFAPLTLGMMKTDEVEYIFCIFIVFFYNY